MRYYNIQILNTDGSTFQTFSSLVNGQPDPGALEIEVDITLYDYDTAAANSTVRVFGIDRSLISQSANLTGKTILISLGMSKGLPLANPAQVGGTIRGTIFQAFGNWQGTLLSLDIIFTTYTGTQNNPANFSFSWPANSPLSSAITRTLTAALPTLRLNVSVSPRLVLSHDQQGVYPTLELFSRYLKEMSRSIIRDRGYPGVTASISGNTLNVSDFTDTSSEPKPIMIDYVDLIGQPAWVNAGTMQFLCVMRGDIIQGSMVTLPNLQIAQTAAQGPTPSFRDNLTFSGKWLVIGVRLVGKFRQPNGDAWITAINVNPVTTDPATPTNTTAAPTPTVQSPGPAAPTPGTSSAGSPFAAGH